jgi:hypothetical protein
MTKRGKGSKRTRRDATSAAASSSAAPSSALVIPPWCDLPDLVTEAILDKLTVHERANAMLTNKRWRDVSVR